MIYQWRCGMSLGTVGDIPGIVNQGNHGDMNKDITGYHWIQLTPVLYRGFMGIPQSWQYHQIIQISWHLCIETHGFGDRSHKFEATQSWQINESLIIHRCCDCESVIVLRIAEWYSNVVIHYYCNLDTWFDSEDHGGYNITGWTYHHDRTVTSLDGWDRGHHHAGVLVTAIFRLVTS